MFELGFPRYMSEEMHNVLRNISIKTYNNVSIGYTESNSNEECQLLDGSVIEYPYRMYFVDDENLYHNLRSKEEQLIYHCIFTRSCNGYVREKHLKAILEEDFPEWCIPYILKLSSEYIVEIVELIYEFLKEKDNSMFQAVCQNNPYLFRYYHSRMISYWNEFYRDYCNQYHNYVGHKLYKECFGYQKRMDFIT